MFMRFLQIKIKRDVTAEFERFYEEIVMPQMQKVPGCLFAGLIRHKPEENEFASLTFWKEQEDAENYEQSGIFQSLVDKARPLLSESNEWKIHLSDNMQLEYEPVAEEPVIKKYSVADAGYHPDKLNIKSSPIYIRIVSVKVQPGKAEEFKDLFNTEVIPVLKSTKGCRDIFLTQSIHQNDEFISVTIWDSEKDAELYENSGKFAQLAEMLKKTFSQFYLWKMSLEKNYSAKVKTSEDIKIEKYDLITGRSF